VASDIDKIKAEAEAYCNLKLNANSESKRFIRSLLAAVNELQRDNLCAVCAGTGKPTSGKPCACGGSGKACDEAQGIREMYVKLEQQLAAKDAEITERNKIIVDKIKTCDDLREERDTLGAALEKCRRVLDEITLGDDYRLWNRDQAEAIEAADAALEAGK
jgi:hypothetical protein